MELHLKEQPPEGAFAVEGGPQFYLWCRAGEARAAARRDAIARGWSIYGRSCRDGDPYPGALILAQRLGVALEDLARLLLALEADEPWTALRGARIQQLDDVYERLADKGEAARTVFQLPSPESLEASNLPGPVQEVMLDASEAMARRWHQQLVGCASGWQLLRRLTKAMRHGSPVLPRELVEGPPGAGDLAAGVQPVEGRWVMLIPTKADAVEPPYTTERALADLRDETLRRVRQAGLDGVALARVLAGLHVTRLDTRSLIALPNDALAGLDPGKRRLLTELRRG